MNQHLTGPFPDNVFQLMHTAIRWWQSKGFHYVDLPWIVPQRYSDATRPPTARDISTPQGSFVASGEQSFLYLWENEILPRDPVPGFIGWTPCLRDELVLDEHHQHGFMKAEWFVPLAPDQEHYLSLAKLIKLQVEMFEFVAGRALDKTGYLELQQESPLQLDLVLSGIEVGSYGVRSFNGAAYIYGTALALPRFSQALRAERR